MAIRLHSNSPLIKVALTFILSNPQGYSAFLDTHSIFNSSYVQLLSRIFVFLKLIVKIDFMFLQVSCTVLFFGTIRLWQCLGRTATIVSEHPNRACRSGTACQVKHPSSCSRHATFYSTSPLSSNALYAALVSGLRDAGPRCARRPH